MDENKNLNNENIEETKDYLEFEEESNNLVPEVIENDKYDAEDVQPNKAISKVLDFIPMVAMILILIALIVFYTLYSNGDIKISIFDKFYANNEEVEDKIDYGKIQISTTDVTNKSIHTISNVADMVENVLPSMVSVSTVTSKNLNNEEALLYYYYYGNYTDEVELPGSGSGIIIGKNDKELLIVTNEHVICDADSVIITFVDGLEVEGRVKNFDDEKDIAIIAIDLKDIAEDTINTIKIATIGDSNSARLGEQVIAIGNSLGYGETITSGIISALNRQIMDEDGATRKFIQVDAAINPGNSGGALLNMNGEVIGINEAKIADSDIDGVGFAIPISDVISTIEELSNNEIEIVDEKNRGYFGIGIRNVSEDANKMYNIPNGIFVLEVYEESKKANPEGLMSGDIIIGFEDLETPTVEKLQKRLRTHKKGDIVNIKINRLENGTYVEKELSIILVGNSAFDDVDISTQYNPAP